MIGEPLKSRTLVSPFRATVIADASYCQQTAAAGWAVWVKFDGGRKICEHGTFQTRPKNSTEAEVMAAAIGVWYAAREGASHILVQSDCMSVIQLVQGKTKSETLISLWDKVVRVPPVQGVYLTSRHVKGHGLIKDARTWVNDWCDRYARQHMENERGHYRRAHSQSNRQVSGGEGRAGSAKPRRAPSSWSIAPRP